MEKTVLCGHVDKSQTTEVPVSELTFRPSIYGVIVEDDKILLVPSCGDGYDFPGGGIELGETLEEALIRECKEETGLDVKPDLTKVLHVESDFFYSDYMKTPYHTILMYYKCTVTGGEISTEGFDEYEKEYADEAQWVDVEKAKNAKFYNGVNVKTIIERAL